MENLADGPMTALEYGAQGVGRAELLRLIRRGEVRPVLRGVFVRADYPDTVELRCRCLVRVLRQRRGL